MEAKSNEVVMARPSFQLGLAFELACRKKAFKMVTMGTESIATALEKIQEDVELKELHFLTPFRFQRSASSQGNGTAAGSAGPLALPPANYGGCGSKGGNKGGGKQGKKNGKTLTGE